MSTTSTSTLKRAHAASVPRRPRIGFLGLGWIGLARMRSIVQYDAAEIVAIADCSAPALAAAYEVAPHAHAVDDLDRLLKFDLDGVVIATPSALHSTHASHALESGCAVFCQKPLGRNTAETHQIIETAKTHNRLLSVDFSYRHVEGMDQARELIRTGQLGEIFLADFRFHNAYGPDKPWFYDITQSGGGCVIDLGTHLIDLVVELLGPQHEPVEIRSCMWQQGRRWHGRRGAKPSNEAPSVEDVALIDWSDARGTRVQIACSWNLPAGQDAIIGFSIYGTLGAVEMRNLHGSFYDLVVERCDGTRRTELSGVDRHWGEVALAKWIEQLKIDASFDSSIERVLMSSKIIDRIYQQ